MHDALVIGAGPNGLSAACHLARGGWSVLVLEARELPGGAVTSGELTLPGFLHDAGAAFFPFAATSPAFVPLDLPGAGLTLRNAPLDSAHVALDGTCPALGRDLAAAAATLGADAPALGRLAAFEARYGARLVELLLAPLPALGEARRLGVRGLFRFACLAGRTARGAGRHLFRGEAARRILPALSLHVDLAPDDACSASLGLVLALLASSAGFPVAEGGASALTRALLRRLAEAGGELRGGARVTAVLVRKRRAVGVRTERGEVFEARRAILADVSAPALYLRLLDPRWVPGRVTRAMRRFDPGFGTFKLDWALAGAVPWRAEPARRAAVVHTGESVDDLARFAQEVRSNRLPHRPYLVIGQPTLADPTRAPPGRHTLWAYSRVPPRLPGGWRDARESFADTVEERIEELAPGFRALVLARAARSPDDLEAENENLLGGGIGGGTARLRNQLFLRPVFPYFRHRTPVRGLYLASSYTHPGAGVHGACGHNAARAALRDAGG